MKRGIDNNTFFCYIIYVIRNTNITMNKTIKALKPFLADINLDMRSDKKTEVNITGSTVVYCYYVPPLRKLFFAHKKLDISNWLRTFDKNIKVNNLIRPTVAKIREIDFDLTNLNIKQYI